MKEYPDMALWQGRIDAAEGPLGLRWHQMVKPLSPLTAPGTTTLLGFACDAGVARNQGRPGARNGPAALRKMLANMPVHACKNVADAGDVLCLPERDGPGHLEAAQEALANAARHAHARKLRVALRGPAPVHLLIADDGQGFQPERVSDGRFGLLSMRERAIQVGARLQVRSAIGHGTEIVIEWPDSERQGS